MHPDRPPCPEAGLGLAFEKCTLCFEIVEFYEIN